MKVLVLDAGTSAATTIVQDLGRLRAQIHTLRLSGNKEAPSRYVARRLPPQPDVDPLAYGGSVETLHEREQYDLIVPTSEIALKALQALGPGHPIRRAAVLASHRSVEIALDKTQTRDLAVRLGIPVPQAKLITRGGPVPPPASYPVMLKPVESQILIDEAYQYAQPELIRDSAEYDWFLERWLPHTNVEQQVFMPGHGWAVSCLYERGTLRWHFAHERLHELPLAGGASSYRRSVHAPGHLLEAARRLLDELSWHGIAMVEFRASLDTGAATLMEINPRAWGSIPLAVRSGVHFPQGLARIVSCTPVGAQPEYRTDQRMRNMPKDLQWIRANWSADHADPLLLTRPRLVSLMEWFRPLLGTEAWDHVSWRDPGPGLQQLAQEASRLVRALVNRATGLRWRIRIQRLHRRNLARWSRSGRKSGTINFICHGNICRSPFAEQLARATDERWSVTSTGLHAHPGRRTPERIQRAAAAAGVDLSQHRAKSLEASDVKEASLLVVMDPQNAADLMNRFPGSQDKIILLGLAARRPVLAIPDPISLSEAGIRGSGRIIEDAITRLLSAS